MMRYRSWLYLVVAMVLTLVQVTAVSATTNHTIIIDGTNDFSADEVLPTSTAGYSSYVTWDANNLYLGFTGDDVGSSQSSTKWMVWYIDTGPTCVPTSGSGTTDAAGFNTQDWTLPFNADFFLQVRTDGGFNQLSKWGGSVWNPTPFNGAMFDNNATNTFEISIPLVDIASPDDINIVGYFINEQGGGEFTYGIFPNDSGLDGYQAAGSFSTFYHFDLTGGISPNLTDSVSDCRVDNTTQVTSHYSIQDAISAATVGDTIVVPAGRYQEQLFVDTGVVLQGANVGTAGNSGSRVAETVIDGGTGTAVTVNAANTILNGFEIQGSQGVSVVDQAGLVVDNNLFNVDISGIAVQQQTGALTIQNNAINLSQQSFNGGDAAGEHTSGISLVGVSATPTIASNDINGAFYGYALYGVGATPAPTILGGTITGVMQGISAFNTLDGITFLGSDFVVDSVTMSGFTGTSAFVNNNFHSGVYAFTGDAGASTPPLLMTLNNVNVDGTGKPQSNSAALHFADFSDEPDRQQVMIVGGNLSNNVNRGLYARGNVAVSLDGTALTNNGADPFGAGGNDGYAVIARNGATMRVENAQITNPAAQVSATAYAFHGSLDTPALTLVGNTVTNGHLFNVSGATVTAYANNFTSFTNAHLDTATGTINARHNWWGSHSSQPTGVDTDSWNYRLGADMVSYADGTGTISLADAIASDNASLTGAGTLVIVNHGNGLVNAPFGKAISSEVGAAQCSDFYDFFVLGGSGNYDLSVPVSPAICGSGIISDTVYQFELSGTMPDPTCSPDTACWHEQAASRVGDVLTINVPSTSLQGTPFVAPSVNNLDPTAVSLQSVTTSTTLQWGLWASLIFLMAITLLLWRNHTNKHA